MKKRFISLLIVLMILFTGIVVAEENQPLTVEGKIHWGWYKRDVLYVGEHADATPSIAGGVGFLWCDFRAEYLIGDEWLPWWVGNRSTANRGSSHSYSLWAIASASKLRFYIKVYDEAGDEAEWLSPEVEIRKTIYPIGTSEVTVGINQTVAIRNQSGEYNYQVRVRDESIVDASGNTIIDAKIANNTYKSTATGMIICGQKVGSTEIVVYDKNGNITKTIIVHVQKDPYYPPEPEPEPTGVEGFVTRCYKLILGRIPDAAGLEAWATALSNGSAAASQIIDGFVNSQEFKNKNYSHAESVTILYKAMLGREPDAAGLAAWTQVLDQGNPFGAVINGFCGSTEFKNLCEEYCIKPGSVDIGPAEPDNIRKIKEFVSRCYQVILGRGADQAGLDGWANALADGTAAASQIIDGFVNSQEFLGKNYSHAEAVTILYRAMLGRDPDPAGLAAWTEVLDQGYPFGSVINGFCGSQEFAALCEQYGIIPGSVEVNALSGAEWEEDYEEPVDLSQDGEAEFGDIIEEEPEEFEAPLTPGEEMPEEEDEEPAEPEEPQEPDEPAEDEEPQEPKEPEDPETPVEPGEEAPVEESEEPD